MTSWAHRRRSLLLLFLLFLLLVSASLPPLPPLNPPVMVVAAAEDGGQDSLLSGVGHEWDESREKTVSDARMAGMEEDKEREQEQEHKVIMQEQTELLLKMDYLSSAEVENALLESRIESISTTSTAKAPPLGSLVPSEFVLIPSSSTIFPSPTSASISSSTTSTTSR